MEEQNSQEENSFEFLPDQPLSAKELENIRFGHEGIAETLQNMISKCPTPFTIGLFGKWGVGKSTIINLLSDSLGHDKLPVVYFDVWKYESDSLRRQLLLSLESALKKLKQLPDGSSLDRTLQASVSRQTETERKLDFGLLRPYWIFITIILLPFISLWGYGVYRQGWSIDKLLSLVGWGTLATLLLGLVSMLSQAVKTTTTTETVDRLNSPEEFESQFNKILENVRAKKVLITIDNLDRCSHDCAVKLLSTLKTFLEVSSAGGRNKVIFLIPCDDEAIKKHLASVYLKNQTSEEDVSFSPDEFLRKFFNAFLRIPEFIGTELDDYTRELLQQTKGKEFDDDSVAWIITKAFRDNPRQIKQFINTLLSHYFLANQRESGNNPLIQQAGAITKNIPFLAKFLIMLQRFPNAMERLNERSMQLSEVISDFESFKQPVEDKEKEFEDFKQFLIDTPHIDADNIGLFFKFKQSEEELMIPEADKLITALRDNDSKYIKEKLDGLKSSKEDLNNFEKIIISQLAQNKHKPMNLVGIISSSLASLNEFQIKLRPNFYREIGATIRSSLLPHLHNLKPSVVFEELLEYDPHSRDALLKQYGKILANLKEEKPSPEITELAYELLGKIIEHENWFSEKAIKERVSNALAGAYITDIEVAKLFGRNPSAQKRFLNESVLNKFIVSVSDDDVENKALFTEKIDLFLSLERSTISKQTIQSLFQKLKELIQNEIPKPYPGRENIKENLFGKSDEILSELGSLVKEEKVLEEFSDAVIQSADVTEDWMEKRIFMPVFLKLINLVSESKKQEIDNRIQQFFTNTSLEGIKYVFGKIT